MGVVWRYCDCCGVGLSKPTLREYLEHDFKCPRCGDEGTRKDETIWGDLFLELLERVEELERKNNETT